MAFLDWYLERCREELEEAKRQLADLESGRFKLGEKTIEHPEWRDITPEAIARTQHTIKTYEDILARREREG